MRGAIPPLPQYTYMAWYLVKHRDNFTFSFDEGKFKNKGAFQKKYIYCKYKEMKLISHFNVILLDFNAPVPAFHMFLNPARKKVFWFCL
jgi:hypothetical protein